MTSDDDDTVLMAFIPLSLLLDEAARPSSVTARWTLTAQGVDDLIDGELTIPVAYRDLRKPLAVLLSAADEGSEQIE